MGNDLSLDKLIFRHSITQINYLVSVCPIECQQAEYRIFDGIQASESGVVIL